MNDPLTLPGWPLAFFLLNLCVQQFVAAWHGLTTQLSRVQLLRMAEEHPAPPVRRRLRRMLDRPLRHGLTAPMAMGFGHLLNYFLALRLGAQPPEALIICLILVLVAQLLPRLAVTAAPEWTAAITAPVFAVVDLLLSPFTVPLGTLVEKLARLREEVAGDEADDPAAAQQEVDALIRLGQREGIIEDADKALIQGALDFGDAVAREVMTPRTDIVSLEKTASLADLLAVLVENRHTRIPLHGESLDEIAGILYVKDIYPMIEVGAFDAPLLPHARPPVFAPASKPLHALLQELRLKREQLAIIVDEYGGTAGLVTLEDLLEEIVGDINDPHEETSSDFARDTNGEISVPGDFSLYEFNARAERALAAIGVETVGGWLTTHLGRIPQAGEILRVAGENVEVLEAEPRRVLRVKFLPATAAG